MKTLATIAAAIAILTPTAAVASPASNYGGGGGGYQQLPTCNSTYWGTTLYVQGYTWYCAYGSNHWVIV